MADEVIAVSADWAKRWQVKGQWGIHVPVATSGGRVLMCSAEACGGGEGGGGVGFFFYVAEDGSVIEQ